MNIALSFAAEKELEAGEISLKYGFELNQNILPRLNLTADRLELLINGFKPLFVDILGNINRRKDQIRQQGVIKACMIGKDIKILDLTAGWGRDSSLLASLGAHVLMLERNPMMAALLLNGLERFANSSKFKSGSLNLLYVDAKNYLQELSSSDYPDVIYIDPMHPVRQKSALVKKDMQSLKLLIGADIDAMALISLAIGKAKKRVVVKWPQNLQPMLQPKQSISGSTVRFDLYF